MAEGMGCEDSAAAGSGGSSDEWATHTARSLDLAGTVSRLLFFGAGAALALGVLASVLTYASMDTSGAFGEVTTLGSTGSRIALAQSASILLGSLLPTGLLAAAAVALRLQADRFQVDVLDR